MTWLALALSLGAAPSDPPPIALSALASQATLIVFGQVVALTPVAVHVR